MVTAETRPNDSTLQHTVAAIFNDEDRTVRALEELKAAGFTSDHVSVVLKDRREASQLAERAELAGDGSGAAGGAVSGGVIGGLAGFLVGVSALVIPGIGPIVGTGILVSTLAGAGIGAAAGGLVGALIDQGVPEEDARSYERHVGEGRTLVTVGAPSVELAHEAERIMNAHGGEEVRRYGRNA